MKSSSIPRKVAKIKLPPAHIQSIQPYLGVDSSAGRRFALVGKPFLVTKTQD